MRKKYSKIGILLLIILMLFSLTGCSLNYKNKENVIALLDKTANYTNYRMEIKSDAYDFTMNLKDNVILITSNATEGETYSLYYNLPDDEIIIMDEDYALVASIDEYLIEEPNTKLDSILSYSESISETFESDEYEYTYIEKTKLNDEICIVVSLKNDSEERIYTISTITGVAYKLEVYNSKETLTEHFDSTIELDCVTDEDIARPDLNGMKVYKL